MTTRIVSGRCQATAHSNIALAKYWGKRNVELNIPGVPSLSMGLSALATTTSVEFDPACGADQLLLNGDPAPAAALQRVTSLLESVRRRAGFPWHARVVSHNDFPTASGLASSASGFAALACASLGAAGLESSAVEVSELARSASVSAARSVFGGFVEMAAGATAAEPIQVGTAASRLRMVVAVTTTAAKPVGSTLGMMQTKETSPFYDSWLRTASDVHRELKAALIDEDFERLGDAMEHSALAMHATMLAARPALIYFNAATMAAIHCVRDLRKRGIFAYFTVDAGPHVKVLTSMHDSGRVAERLGALPGVCRVIESGSGGGAHFSECSTSSGGGEVLGPSRHL